MLTNDEALALIANSKYIQDEQRLDIFEYLSERFSLIPIRGGFSPQNKPGGSFKAPKESGWSKWCKEKRPFDRNDFEPERAGVACGPASGVLVLDIDDEAKFNNWCQDNNVEELPKTLIIKTGGEGNRFHYYYEYPKDGFEYGNKSNKEGGFDIRGLGGQVICPGSLHPETQEPYIIHHLANLAPAPDWMKNFCLRVETFLKPEDADTGTANKKAEDKQVGDETMLPLEIQNLPVSDEIKQTINTSYPKGQRSEPSMKVLIALYSRGVDDITINNIYKNYPIGEKSRLEPGWLQREKEKAKEYIASMGNQGISSNDSNIPAKSAPTPVSYKTFNALDIVSADVKFEYLIDHFWPLGEPLLITGQGGTGKSLMTLQIAMDLINTSPQSFLKNHIIPPKDHKVLFVQSENSLPGMKERLSQIRTGYHIEDSDLKEKMFFLGVGNDVRSFGDMMKPVLQNAIKNSISDTGVDIVVIDPLISFHNMNENSNDEMRQLLDNITVLCEECKVTPLLIHHHSKITSESGPGGGRGASAIGDWSPNTWELSFSKKDSIYKLVHRKARNFKLQDNFNLDLINLRFHPKTGTSNNLNVQYVVEALNALGGQAKSQKELKDKVIEIYRNKNGKEVASGTAGNFIKETLDAGKIKEIPGQTSNSKGYKIK